METGREEKSGDNVSGTGWRARAADEAAGGRVWDAVMPHAWRLFERTLGRRQRQQRYHREKRDGQAFSVIQHK